MQVLQDITKDGKKTYVTVESGSASVDIATTATAGIVKPDGTSVTIDLDGTIHASGTSSGVSSVNTRTGAVTLSKSDVGLSNVDNTSDANKPISTATQTALDGKQATGSYEVTTNKENTTIDTSTTKYPTVNLLKTGLDNKVDKVTGKGLSTEDYTTTEKTKLSGIETGAEVNNISDANATDLTDGGATTLHKHSYNNLDDKPTIPTQYTDEMAQDAVGTILTDGTTVDFTYNDAIPSITAEVKDASISLAKMANVNSGTVFYRKTASAGTPEVQTLATLKTDLGLTGTNSGDQVVPANTTATSNQFFTAYNNTTGAFTKAQPTWANINKSTSNIADITTKSHTSLTDIGTNTHAQIDTAIGTISSKANDSAVVHNTGDETIAGVKTFSSFSITPSSAPTTNYQIANKKYVDDGVASANSYTDSAIGNSVSYFTATGNNAYVVTDSTLPDNPTGGTQLFIKFLSSNIAQNTTLKLNNGTAYSLYLGNSLPDVGEIKANGVYVCLYNGSSWDMLSASNVIYDLNTDSNTTPVNATQTRIIKKMVDYLNTNNPSTGNFEANPLLNIEAYSGMNLLVNFTTASSPSSNARFTPYNNYNNIKNESGTQLLASDVQGKTLNICFNGTDWIVKLMVIDNLTSTSTTYPLSANQGKVLKDTIDVGTLKSKIISATRDAGATSGDVSYTGVGFVPSSIRAIMTVDGTLYNSDGFSDSAKTTLCRYQSSANVYYKGTNLVSYTNYSAWAQNAIVKTYDSDGFTLTWSKIGTPTAGTLQIMFICYK